MKREDVYKAIDTERAYQDARWAGTKSSGIIGSERGSLDRTIDEFGAYIVGYANELLDKVRLSDNPIEKLTLVRKIAALCVACGEAHGMPER